MPNKKHFMDFDNAKDVFSECYDKIDERIKQYSAMPTASSDLEDKIIQYTGTTTSDYVSGYFYKCVEGSTTGTYEWEEASVQKYGDGAVYSATILANGWDSNNRQTVAFTGYSVAMNGMIGMPSNVTAAQKLAYSTAVIRVYSASANSITFECENVPEIDLPVTIIVGGGESDYQVYGTAAFKNATNTITAGSTDLAEAGAVKSAIDNVITNLGTAAAKDSTNAVTSGSTNLVESGAVYDAIQNAINSFGVAENTSF